MLDRRQGNNAIAYQQVREIVLKHVSDNRAEAFEAMRKALKLFVDAFPRESGDNTPDLSEAYYLAKATLALEEKAD
jgi:hypothetical protein